MYVEDEDFVYEMHLILLSALLSISSVCDVSPQKKQDFAKLFAVVSIRSVRNHCVKILSQGLNYCYVDKLPKSIILCEQ